MGNLTHEDKDGRRLYRYELDRAEALLIKSRRSLELVTKEHARALEQEAARLEAQAAELREESAQALAALADEDQEAWAALAAGAGLESLPAGARVVGVGGDEPFVSWAEPLPDLVASEVAEAEAEA